MTPEDALQVADEVLRSHAGSPLTDIQRMILRESLAGKGYESMEGYTSQHIKNEGKKLWDLLSQALREKVSKTNFKGALEKRLRAGGIVPKQPIPSTYNSATWVGRELIVEELLAKLQEPARLLWITGISGIGKTTLGECLASKAWDSDPSFQWIHMEILEGQIADFTTGAAELLAKLGDKDLDPQERNDPRRLTERLLRKLQANRYWIQLDALERLLNPEQPSEFADAHWLAFLQRCLTESDFFSRLVLTAQALPTALTEFSDRYPNVWQGMTLRGLSTDKQHNEYLELFIKNGISVDGSNQSILSHIGQIYEGHPLVLQVIAKEILASPFHGNVVNYWQRYSNEFEQVARELQTERISVALYNQALQRQVRRRVEASLKRLPTDALILLCRSSVYRRPVPETFWLAMIEDRTPTQQQEAYQVLGDRALVERENIHKSLFLIRQHNLIRDVVYDLLKQDFSIWESAERKAANLWVTAYEPASDVENLEKVRGYLEAFYHYCELGDWKKASEILFFHIKTSETQGDLNGHLFMWNYYHEQVQLLSKLLGKVDLLTDTICSLSLGNVYTSIGNYSVASDYYTLSLKTARELGSLEKKCNALGGLGIVHQALGDYPTAIHYHQKNLEIAYKISDWRGVEAALGNLGTVALQTGNYSQALENHQQSLVIARKVGSIQGEASALLNIGSTNLCLGHYSQAIYFSEQSLEVSKRIHERSLQSKALSNLGTAYGCSEDYSRAIEYREQALRMTIEIGNYLDQVTAFKNLGANYFRLGQYIKSVEYYEQYLAVSRKLQDYRAESDALHNLGTVYYQLQDYTSAARCYQQQVNLVNQLDNAQMEASALGNLGVAMAQSGEYKKALEALLRVLGIFRQIGDKASEANCLRNLAGLHRKMGQFRQAQGHCEQSLAIAEELRITLAEECKRLKEELKKEAG